MYWNARAIFRGKIIIFMSKICYFTYQSYNWNTKYICAHLKGFILMSVKAKILLILSMMKVISSKLVWIVSNIKIIVFFILASWRKEYLQILCVVQGNSVPFFFQLLWPDLQRSFSNNAFWFCCHPDKVTKTFLFHIYGNVISFYVLNLFIHFFTMFLYVCLCICVGLCML